MQLRWVQWFVYGLDCHSGRQDLLGGLGRWFDQDWRCFDLIDPGCDQGEVAILYVYHFLEVCFHRDRTLKWKGFHTLEHCVYLVTSSEKTVRTPQDSFPPLEVSQICLGNIFAKTTELRINLGDPIPSLTHTHPSHSQTPRLLSTSLSLGIPFPRCT